MLTHKQHVFILVATMSLAPLFRAIEKHKTQTGLGCAMNCSPQRINNWIKRGRVPAAYCPGIERILGEPGVCEELRPDVDWACRRYVAPAAQEAA